MMTIFGCSSIEEVKKIAKRKTRRKNGYLRNFSIFYRAFLGEKLSKENNVKIVLGAKSGCEIPIRMRLFTFLCSIKYV